MVGENPTPNGVKDIRADLRILATSDLHMQVLAYNYHTGVQNPEQGFVHTVTLIREAQKEAANTLLVDNGDLLCGAGTNAAFSDSQDLIHPMINIMNQVGYDAATLGNHDFDHGLDFTVKATSQAKFPFVSANTAIQQRADCGNDLAIFHPFTLLDRTIIDTDGTPRKICIGITGFLPPGSISQFNANMYQITTSDIIDAARAIVPRMKNAGADIIIALAHTGICGEKHKKNMENAAIPLATIPGIDAIIAGHKHQVFPNDDWPNTTSVNAGRGTVHGVPVVSPGFGGSHLGLIDLELIRYKNRWSITKHTSSVRPISRPCKGGAKTVKADPMVTAEIEGNHQHMLEWIAKPVGEIQKSLTSYFSLAAPSRAIQTIQRAQIWFTENRLQEYFDPGLPLLSSACSFKFGGYGGPQYYTNILPGILTRRGVTDLYPFPNHIALLQMNGALLLEWLERSASVFNQAKSGDENRFLKSSKVPAYLFETVLGLDYTINLDQRARYNQTGHIKSKRSWRISNLTYNGNPVAPDQEFNLITNNFRLGGGGFYPEACLQNRLHIPGIGMQTVLAEYFSAHPTLDTPLVDHWNFAPMPGAGMLFRSSPKALQHMGDVVKTNIRPLGVDKTGFQLFELML